MAREREISRREIRSFVRSLARLDFVCTLSSPFSHAETANPPRRALLTQARARARRYKILYARIDLAMASWTADLHQSRENTKILTAWI